MTDLELKTIVGNIASELMREHGVDQILDLEHELISAEWEEHAEYIAETEEREPTEVERDDYFENDYVAMNAFDRVYQGMYSEVEYAVNEAAEYVWFEREGNLDRDDLDCMRNLLDNIVPHLDEAFGVNHGITPEEVIEMVRQAW